MTAADELAGTDPERACLATLRELCGETDGPMERHSVRVYLLARKLAEHGGHEVDAELMLCAAFLHDLGLYPGAASKAAYVTDSRRLAERVLGDAGWSAGRIELCGEAVERHHELTAQWAHGTEVELLRRADLVEVSQHLIAFGLSREERAETLRTARREGFVGEVARGLARAARQRPASMWRIFKPVS